MNCFNSKKTAITLNSPRNARSFDNFQKRFPINQSMFKLKKTRSFKESYERPLEYLTWPWFADHRFKFGARSALKGRTGLMNRKLKCEGIYSVTICKGNKSLIPIAY